MPAEERTAAEEEAHAHASPAAALPATPAAEAALGATAAAVIFCSFFVTR